MSLNFIDTPKCRGEFHVEVRRNGKIIDEYADHNLVVDGGRVRLAELAAGLSQKHITQIGIGEGLAPEDETDTELVNQVLFPITRASVTERDARFEFTIGEEQANGMSVSEFGLFCADDTMFSHRVRLNEETGKVAAIDKMSDIEITGYWILHF